MEEKQTYPLNTIYFYLTEGCNLCCRHCWITPKFQKGGVTYPSLDIALFESIVKQAKPMGLTGVKLTGGEPLMHPEIHGLLKIVREEDLRLTVETNGILCTPELAREMAACKNPFVAVSLDGVDGETHDWVRGVEGSFDEAQDGVRNLVKAGLRTQIIMSIMRRNKDQMEGVVRLAETLGVRSVKFNPVMPTARGEDMHEAGETLTIEELVELGEWVENELSASTDLRILHSHPLAFRPLGKIFSNNGNPGLCGILGILGVLSNGSYALCGIGETVPELNFGNAARDSLKDVWENAPKLLELREGLPGRLEGVCSECIMKNDCLGLCIAQNYYATRSLFAPLWYCDQARARGLFPESRLVPKTVQEVAAV